MILAANINPKQYIYKRFVILKS